MAAKSGYPLGGSKSPGAFLLAGSFVTDGTSAPSVTTGAGFTVGAPSTGLYTITLSDGACPGVISAQVSIEDDSGSSTVAALLDDTTTVATNGTFTIQTQSAAGTDADLTGPIVHFSIWIRNTQVQR